MKPEDAIAIMEAIRLLQHHELLNIGQHSFVFDPETAPKHFIAASICASARSIGEYVHAQGWAKTEEAGTTNSHHAMVTEILVIDFWKLKKAQQIAKESRPCGSTLASAKSTAANSSGVITAGAKSTPLPESSTTLSAPK